jgi:hypothetical protein
VAPATAVGAQSAATSAVAVTTTTVPISLDQLEMGMVPVMHSVQIEEIEADGTATGVRKYLRGKMYPFCCAVPVPVSNLT